MIADGDPADNLRNTHELLPRKDARRLLICSGKVISHSITEMDAFVMREHRFEKRKMGIEEELKGTVFLHDLNRYFIC